MSNAQRYVSVATLHTVTQGVKGEMKEQGGLSGLGRATMSNAQGYVRVATQYVAIQVIAMQRVIQGHSERMLVAKVYQCFGSRLVNRRVIF